MNFENVVKYLPRVPKVPKDVFNKILRLLISIVIVAVIIFLIALEPQDYTRDINMHKSATFQDGGIDVNNLVKIDKSFNDDHISKATSQGFTSPYGYYYFDSRVLPEGQKGMNKKGLFYYNYNSGKTTKIDLRTSEYPLSDMWQGGIFYKDRLYLIQHHNDVKDSGFDIYRGKADGSSMEKIYSCDKHFLDNIVCANNKMYFSIREQTYDDDLRKDENETSLMCLNLENLVPKDVTTYISYNAKILLEGFYGNKLYYSVYGRSYLYDNDKKVNQNKITTPIDIRYFNITNNAEGKFQYGDIPGNVTFLDNLIVWDEDEKNSDLLNISNQKTKMHFTFNINKSEKDNAFYDNTNYEIFDGKLFYGKSYTNETDKLTMFDFDTKKIKEFTRPTIQDPQGKIKLRIHQVVSDGLIFDKMLLDSKGKLISMNLCYISKEDYYAGKPIFLDFDY